MRPWLESMNVAINLLSVIIIGLLYPLWRYMRRIRENDLHGITEGLSRIERRLETELVAAALRLEHIDARLNEHLSWHLNQRKETP